jgi:Cof subfamily protein (haloacid dehalogenase superfamily)
VLIATDLDGTLVPDGSVELPRYTAEVLKRVDAAGVPVVFVTGRPVRWTAPLWPHVGHHGLAIVSNGAITYDVHGCRTIRMAGIEPALGLRVTATIAGAVPGCVFAIECADGIRRDPDFPDRDGVPDGSPCGPLPEIWDVPAVKLLVVNRTLPHDEFGDGVIAAVGDIVNVTWSLPGLIEISAPGVTKASALSDLCAGLGVSADEVVAFGDMPNDLPMLSWAGRSYGMAGGHASVLAVVDSVAPSCQEEGVAQVLEALLSLET